MKLNLNNKVVIVTGANGGIGTEICKQYLAEDAKVVATDLTADSYNTTEFITADISNQEGVEKINKFTLNTFNQIDILINCAGISEPSSLVTTSEESWNKVININLTAPWRLSKKVMPELIKSKGNIVNLASFAGKRATLFGDNASYTASKSGIIGLTYALALEYAKDGVRVNAVAPGPVNTPMLQALPQEKRDQLLELIPLKKLPTITDIANAILFLSSDAAKCITGEIMDVNGGLYLD